MQLDLNKDFYMPDYEGEVKKCEDFIANFEDEALEQAGLLHGKFKYMNMLQTVADRENNEVVIDVEDLRTFFNQARVATFVDRVASNCMRYVNLFQVAIDKKMPEPTKPLSEAQMDVQDHVEVQRRGNVKRNGGTEGQKFPPELFRKYHIYFVFGPDAKKKLTKMRELRANQIGGLVQIKGIVTRVSDVKPCIQVATYACDVCGFETYQLINGREYTPLSMCPSEKCVKNQTKGQLYQQIRTSKFISYQEIKVQEPSDQVPIGHVPRHLKVLAKGAIVKRCSPGDYVTITGIYMPAPFQGFRAMKAGLTHDTFLEAMDVVKEKQNYSEDYITNELRDMVIEERNENPTLYKSLAYSISPEIFKMKKIKRALLLQMIGGVTKQMEDGMKIRGNINVLLMGDPGVAKSQLLKHISSFAPRGIYTTGKGSSGVGLTAAVMKDPVTGEFVLEGGALVLADTGICCIDEFDKMDQSDRTNIHEVMEQQTVSIAKAGITTSLNARTSILAAANPIYGRYNTSKTAQENINLPAALLSRFDMIFLLLDRPNEEADLELAKHVAMVHKTLKAPERQGTNIKTYSEDFMRAYIAYASSFEPIIPPSLHQYIVSKYVEKRQHQREGRLDEIAHMYITPRTLLGIIRLSQGMAKLYLRETVEQSDVDEAIKLMDYSIKTLNADNSKVKKPSQRQDELSKIIGLVRDINTKFEVLKKTPDVQDCLKELKRSMGGKCDEDKLRKTLEHYQKLNVVYVDNKDKIYFV